MARAALRSRTYLRRYFSLWFLRGPLRPLARGSEELVGDGKAGSEAAEPELEAVVWGGEPRNDGPMKGCWCSPSPWEGRG